MGHPASHRASHAGARRREPGEDVTATTWAWPGDCRRCRARAHSVKDTPGGDDPGRPRSRLARRSRPDRVTTFRKVVGTEGGLRWGDPRPGPSRYVSWWECWPLTDEGDTHDDGPVHTPSGANRSQVGATLRDLLRDGPTDVVGQDHVDAVEDAIREVERHDANSGAGGVLDDVVALYNEAYADADPDFFNEDRHHRQLAGHRKAPGWALATATAGAELVGYTYGFRLPATTGWWQGLIPPVPDGFDHEDGHRTFAISGILVRAPWRRQGIAAALRGRLLAGPPRGTGNAAGRTREHRRPRRVRCLGLAPQRPTPPRLGARPALRRARPASVLSPAGWHAPRHPVTDVPVEADDGAHHALASRAASG